MFPAGFVPNFEEDLINRLQLWAKGERPGPYKLLFMPTNACNIKCEICWLRRGYANYEELSPERQLRLADEAADLGVRVVTIAGGGEPLTRWKTLRHFLARVKANGSVWGQLITNGTLITEDAAAHLAEIGWDQVHISLDGLEAGNDLVRGAGTYRQIVTGLRNVLRLRKNGMPHVGVNCVLTRHVVRQLPCLVRFVRDLGCHFFYLSKLTVFLPSQTGFALTEEDLDILPAFLREALWVAEHGRMENNLRHYLAADLASSVVVAEAAIDRPATTVSPSATGSPSGTNASGETRESRPALLDPLCFEPFLGLTVFSNGSTGPCCHSSDEPLTSLLSKSLQEVWYGEEFSRLRREFLAHRAASFCSYCHLNRYLENERVRGLVQIDNTANSQVAVSVS